MKPGSRMAGCLGLVLILTAQAGAVWNLASPLARPWRGIICAAFAIGLATLAASIGKGKTA